MEKEKWNKLKEKRLNRGLTQKELAVLSGLKEETIKALELGLTDRNNIKLSTLKALAKALHCKIVDLID